MYDDNASAQLMALANLMNVKDSRWLQLEVCREFQRGQCSRSEIECKFSHPPPHVEIQNGRVTACYDSIKGRCTRENPKCKYLHPPQHLKDQLLINGKNNLALKNLVMNQFTTPAITTPLGVSPLTVASNGATFVPSYTTAYSPYAAYTFNPAVYSSLVASPDILGSMGLQTGAMASHASVAAAMALQAQKAAAVASATTSASYGARADKTEAAIQQAANALASRNASSLSMATSALNGTCGQPQVSNSKKRPLELENGHLGASATDQYLLAAAQALSNSASKRAAVDKSGMPFYQPYAHIPVSSLGLQQYPQLATMPTLQPSYFPAFSAATNAILTAPPASSAANFLFGLTNQQTPLLGMPPDLALALQNHQPTPSGNHKATIIPTNAYAVAYFDESGQLLDTLPVCRDFKQGRCDRSSCRYVHLTEDYIEIAEGKVTVCRDFVKGKCSRYPCKFYHLPLANNALSPLVQQSTHLLQPSSLIGSPQSFVGGVNLLQPSNQFQPPSMFATPTSSISSALVALQQQANQIAAHYLAVQSAASAAFLANQQPRSSPENQRGKMALASPLPIDFWSMQSVLTPQQQQFMQLLNKTSTSSDT